MTFIDIFGFKRCTGFGPLTVSQSINSDTDEERIARIEEILIDILEDDQNNYDKYNLSEQEITNLQAELAIQVYDEYPETEVPRTEFGPLVANPALFLTQCMESKWAKGWYEGASEQTVDVASDVEGIVSRCSVCLSLMSSDCNPIWQLQLTYSNQCDNCTFIDKLKNKSDE
jgi:hypothetical protein